MMDQVDKIELLLGINKASSVILQAHLIKVLIISMI